MLRNSRSQRTAAAFGLALAAVLALVGCANEPSPSPSPRSSSSSPSSGASPSPSRSTPSSASPVPPITITPAPTQTTAEHAPAAGTAAAVLATLPVKGRAPKTGYDRTGDFGTAWKDVDRNGCDTRDDVLAADLTSLTKAGSCKVTSGTLVSVYSGRTVQFTRGVKTSALVQIDHLVALMDAWQTGAQQISAGDRLALANDPLNLQAVEGSLNEQKGDGDAATWLPPRRAYWCTYVARQISVKHAYSLWVTAAEHDRMASILQGCPGQQAFASTLHPAPAGGAAAAAAQPQSQQSAPVVHPGAFCSPVGTTGVTAAGTRMRCSTKAGDRARWRHA